MGTPYYLDTSTIGNEYQAYSDVPTTWAIPQDGNGKASDAATAAVPVVELTFAAIPTSGTISVYGTTVTLTGVLSAASTAACATALASSINATTTAIGVAVSVLLLPLNKFVYARVKPGNASTVQIMCRHAGSDLNYPANASARVVNTFNLSAVTSPLDFTGGVDGPWAYTFNNASAFGKAALAYGLYFALSNSPTNPPATDYIVVRTKRGGSNLSTTLSTGTAFNATWQSRTYVYDNGTVWSGDNGKYTASFKYTGASSSASALLIGASALLCHAPEEDGNFQIEGGNTVSGSGNVLLLGFAGSGSKIIAKNCIIEEIIESNNVTNSMIVSGNAGTVSNMYADFSGSTIRFRSIAKKLWNSVGSADGTTPPYSQRLVLNGAKVEVIAATGAIGSFVSMVGASCLLYFEWHGGYVKDTNNTYTCATPFSVTKGVVAVIDNVTGITNPSIGYAAGINDINQLVWYQSEGDRPGFRFECPQYAIDWIGDGTFPYTGTAKDQHGRNWSHRLAWNSAPSMYMAVTPMKLAVTYREPAATKTITVQLYVPDTATIYTDELEFELIYVDSAGVVRREQTGGQRHKQLAASRTEIATSAATWTANGLSGHSAKKLSITTSQPIKTNTEVNCRISLCAAKSPAIAIYFSTEPEIT